MSLRSATGALAAAIIAVAGSASAEAVKVSADAPVNHNLRYLFYVKGVLVGEANIDATITDASYKAVAKIKTDGVSGWFVEGSVDANGEGARAAGDTGLTPGKFELKSEAAGQSLDVTVVYAGDAPSEVTAEPAFKPKPYEIDPKAQGGSLDPMAAAVAAMVPTTAGEACGRTLPIFDGRRRIDVVFGAKTGEETADGATVVACEASIKRVAGFKQKHLDRPPYPFIAKFRIEDNGITVPVRIEGETEFGPVVAVLK